MQLSREEFAALVLDHMVQVATGTCSISEETILETDDPLAQEVLAGLLTLHEDLAYQVQRRDAATTELRRLNERLDQHVRKQQRAILELSTPVIRIWDDILVLPLIGTVDTRRAQQITENLLEAIASGSAAVVIMDVTGVPVIDTAVARHILNAVDAARLLGSEVLLTGIRPETARTLTTLGVDLSRLSTRGSLEQGLRDAFRITRRQVTRSSQ